MNNKNKQYVPICFIGAIVIFIAIILFMTKGKYDEYADLKSRTIRQDVELQNLEKKISEIETASEQEELKLKSIKPVYEAKGNEGENLAVYGNMFEEIIRRAQSNGLMIRSIEYDMKPAYDPIYSEFSDLFNVCELKFFLVGSYSQLQSFLTGINNNFNYLTSISTLNITAFQANTDYLLINLGITLYSKKPQKN